MHQKRRFAGGWLKPAGLIQQAQNLETTIIEAPTGWQDYYPAAYGGVQALWGTPAGVRREALRVDLEALGEFLKPDYDPDRDFLPPDLAKAAEAQLRGAQDY